MPNWVNNALRITSSKPERIQAIREKLFTTDDQGNLYLSLAVLIPEDHSDPDYWVDPETARIMPENLNEEGKVFDWYSFRCDKWGCKWDVDPDQCNIEEDTDSNIYVGFESPWSCPVEWYRKLVAAFPDVSVELVAMDEAMDYYWENGKLGSISDQFDERQAKVDAIEQVLKNNNCSPEQYDIDKIVDEFEDGYFDYLDMFDPDTWEFFVGDEDDFIDWCSSYKK